MSSINFDYFFGKIYYFFVWLFNGFTGDFSIFGRIIGFILAIFTVLFLFAIFYSTIRIKEIEKEERRLKKEKFEKEEFVTPARHEKWKLIESHMFSNSPAEWRVAIIEADTILEELTIRLGIAGETLGDRLKNASPSEFSNTQSAWEAHKVRNKIAHSGSSFELTRAEANRVIRIYEDIFREFNYI